MIIGRATVEELGGPGRKIRKQLVTITALQAFGRFSVILLKKNFKNQKKLKHTLCWGERNALGKAPRKLPPLKIICRSFMFILSQNAHCLFHKTRQLKRAYSIGLRNVQKQVGLELCRKGSENSWWIFQRMHDSLEEQTGQEILDNS